MPVTPAAVVKDILKNRNKINDSNEIKKISGLLFNLAMRDKEAAEALLAENNRFLKCIYQVVNKQELLKFAQTYHKGLVENLIRFAGIPEEFATKMREAASEQLNQDAQLNALLQNLPNLHPRRLRLDGRTDQAIQQNALVIKNGNHIGINLGDEFIPMVTRYTRNFNTKLCSVGSSNKREVIILDPEDYLLKQLYEKLKTQLKDTADPLKILEIVKELTKKCFPGSNPENFIKQNLGRGKNVISLSEFILKREGVCRHHTLLNAYFLSRLVQDGLLHGDVIHHRQDFDKLGAHTWNIFRERSGKVYSLDSLWNNVTCVTDEPGALNQLYRYEVEEEVKRMHFLAKQSLVEKINEIKKIIEQKQFIVGDYFLFKGGKMLTLIDNSDKLVPHRVYEIYEAIKKNKDFNNDPQQAETLWQEIKQYAKNAIDNPRVGQNSKTTEFYKCIANDDLCKDNTDLFAIVPSVQIK